MYQGIGLRTPRGSGTNGYVQRNLSYLPPAVLEKRKIQAASAASGKPHLASDGTTEAAPTRRRPDAGILEHQRRRAVEVRLLEWVEARTAAEGHAPPAVEIAKRREELLAELGASRTTTAAAAAAAATADTTHELARLKEAEATAWRTALGISGDYVAGSAFDRELQEERKQQRLEERLAREKERRKREIELEEQKREAERQREKEAKRAAKEQRRREREQRKLDKERRHREKHGQSSGTVAVSTAPSVPAPAADRLSPPPRHHRRHDSGSGDSSSDSDTSSHRIKRERESSRHRNSSNRHAAHTAESRRYDSGSGKAAKRPRSKSRSPLTPSPSFSPSGSESGSYSSSSASSTPREKDSGKAPQPYRATSYDPERPNSDDDADQEHRAAWRRHDTPDRS